MSVRRIVPNIASDRPDLCQDFYGGFLGLRLAMDLGWIATYVSPSNSTAQISVARPPADARSPEQIRSSVASVSVTVEVELTDIQQLYRDAVGRGYPVVHRLTDEPWGVRRFAVNDPNGVVVNIMAHRPRAPEKASGSVIA
jgi:catechol 2,3-dioxygenase-like lactoylglutathione lyase family enzyme